MDTSTNCDVMIDQITQQLKTLVETQSNHHKRQIKALHDKHETQIKTLVNEHETHLKTLRESHDQLMKTQTTSLNNFSLVQSLSKTISEHEKNLETANLQIKSLRKQLTERLSTIKPIESECPQIRLNNTTEGQIIALLSPNTNTLPEPEPNTHILPESELNTNILPESEPDINLLPEVKTLTKIKYKGQIYYQDKLPNHDDEYIVYSISPDTNKPYQIVGKKLKKGTYQFY